MTDGAIRLITFDALQYIGAFTCVCIEAISNWFQLRFNSFQCVINVFNRLSRCAIGKHVSENTLPL